MGAFLKLAEDASSEVSVASCPQKGGGRVDGRVRSSCKSRKKEITLDGFFLNQQKLVSDQGGK